MKKVTILLLSIVVLTLLNSCASGYQKINPQSLTYLSKNTTNDVIFEYKYDVLRNKKYKKKEVKRNIKLVAVKITNNSSKDIVFGKDLRLAYENDSDALIAENESVFKTIKQSPASYLWYLLLLPAQFNKTTTDSRGAVKVESSFPIGLFLGPGIAGGNMIAASSANSNFKNELYENNLIGKTIKKGETVYGLLGLQSNSYESLKLKE
jgi:hypothetical protein